MRTRVASFAVWIGLVVLITIGGAGTARAEEPPVDARQAMALFEEGKWLLRANDWAGACDRFRRSLELAASVSVQIKVARCSAREGRIASAADELRRALDLNQTLAASAKRRGELETVARRELEALEPQVPLLTVRFADQPKDAVVTIDGVELPAAASGGHPLNPGSHLVVATAPGYQEFRREVEFAAGSRITLDVRLEAAVARAAGNPGSTVRSSARPVERARVTNVELAGPLSPPVPVTADRPGASQRTIAMGVGAVGLAALGVAAYFGSMTLARLDDSDSECNSRNQCTPRGLKLRDEATTAQTAGLVMLGVGVALVGSSVTLHVLAPPNSREN